MIFEFKFKYAVKGSKLQTDEMYVTSALIIFIFNLLFQEICLIFNKFKTDSDLLTLKTETRITE